MNSGRKTLSELAGEMALYKEARKRTPGDNDRARFALTGERSGKKWCEVCGDREATRQNCEGDDACDGCA